MEPTRYYSPEFRQISELPPIIERIPRYYGGLFALVVGLKLDPDDTKKVLAELQEAAGVRLRRKD